MTTLKRATYALLLLALPALFLVCSASNPTNPLLPQGTQVGTSQPRTNVPSLEVSAVRFDLAADGVDSVTITALAKNPNGSALSNAQINWSITTRGYTGGTGVVTSTVSTTGSGGSASTGYVAPQLDFVPVGASVTVRGVLQVPSNPQGSPSASVTFILRPKGNGPSSGTDTTTGLPTAPTIIAVTPESIKVDAKPPLTVIVQGTNFAETSQLLLVTAEALVQVNSQFFSSSQMRFTVPNTLKAGEATLFVTAPGDLLSVGFPVTLTTGVNTSTTPTSPAISLILPGQGPVGQATRIVLLGTGFNVTNCPSQGNISMINEFIGLRKLCPVPGEAATSQRLVFDSPVFGATQSGDVSVYVQNDDGTTSGTVTFKVVPSNTNAPVITALAPDTGATTGQNKVLVTGSNFDATHSVIIAGPNIFSAPGDTCTGDGLPMCDNNQCVLNQARGTCTINGTAGFDPFVFFGSGQIEITMPNVGPSAAGEADVLIRTPNGQPSNIVPYLYTSPSNLQPPNISSLAPSGLSGPGCCGQGWGVLILGSNFRKCSSVLIGGPNGQFKEILPTPDVEDCGIRRGAASNASPRERLISLLPPDGMTINCLNRPDMVPLRSVVALTTYMHDLICNSSVTQAFSPFTAAMVPPGQDVTSGGAVSWINESQIRVFFGPDHSLPCSSTSTSSIYVSNDPGRGLSGDLISNAGSFTFANTSPCPPDPTPVPAPALTSIIPTRGICNATPGFLIQGTSLQSITSVEFGLGNPATNLSASASSITGNVPASTTGVCPVGSFNCPTGGICPPTRFECAVSVIATGGGQTATLVNGYTYTSSTVSVCTP